MRLFEGTPFDRPPRCEVCDEFEEACVCPPESPPVVPPESQTVTLAVERRKKGKTVTVVKGLSPHESDLPDLLTQLKTACGAGGTLKNGVLEIQGNHLERIRDCCRSIGYRVK